MVWPVYLQICLPVVRTLGWLKVLKNNIVDLKSGGVKLFQKTYNPSEPS